ncbi:MAG: hypothetical protein AAFV96_06170 [Pseudomonadota bacterium]
MTLAARAGLLLCWLPVMAVLGALYLTVPPSPDQSQFDWMAFIATQGQPYYAGSFDMNWPGAMLLHEAGIRLFGVHAWTWRLTDFLLLTGSTVAGALFLARSNWRLAPFLFLFLYPPLYISSGGWMAGQRDIVATGFLLVASLLALPGWRREGLAMAGAGAAIAMAILIRPTFLSFLAGLALLELLPLTLHHARRSGRGTRLLRLCMGFGAVIGTVIIAGVLLGNIDDFYAQSVEFALSVYAGDPPQDWRDTLHLLFLRSWHWIAALALLGAAAWLWRDRAGFALFLLLGIMATSALSFIVQNKAFAYHLGGVLPVMALFVAAAFETLLRVRQQTSGATRLFATAVLLLAALITLAGTGKKLLNLSDGGKMLIAGVIAPGDGYGLSEGERREIVALVREGSTSSDTVAVYGTHYDLPFRAQRLPPYRYFTPAAELVHPGFAHYDAWLAEIDDGLSARPPAFVIVDRRFIAGAPEQPAPAMRDRVILSRLIDHIAVGHAVAFVNENLVVYRAFR